MQRMSRRHALALAAAAIALGSPLGASAQDWKAKYPTLVYAAVPNENATGTVDRLTPFVDYLTQKLGVKVTFRVLNDFAALIEAQRSGHVHIAYHGPASYARAYMTGVKIEPFVMDVYSDGAKGYYGIFFVKKDSPFQKIEDLKGRNLGLVDPNSTSGNNIPRFVLHKLGIDPETFFSKVVYTGSHENAVIAVQQGTVDVAVNWWNSEKESNLRRMHDKKMANYDDYRIIFKSDLIASNPHTYLADLPADLKAALTKVFVEAAVDAPEMFKKFSNSGNPWAPVTHATYEPVVQLNKFVDDLRKKKK